MPFSESLSLDIVAALAQVDRVEAELTSTAKRFGVELSRSIDLLRDGVRVEIDTAGISAELSRAIDAADATVTVEADTAGVANEISGAVDAADTQAVVTAETSQAVREVRKVGDEAKKSSKDIDLLKQALLGIGIAGAARGIFAVADAGSDLAESTSKASVVFAEGFGNIERFATDAATSLGLSQQAALEATGTFGNLFQALGTTREEATALAPQVVQLAGDLASFNNLGTDEALEKIRSGLVGEIEPLRSLGVSFLAADVERKAFELGLASTNETLTEGDKVLARYALIVEQTALAQGDFARTSDGLANQQRILRAEFANVIAEAGTKLQPIMLELVGTTRDDLVPVFGALATEALPSLVSILGDLTPVLGSSLSILVALAPALDAVATVIDAIPAPLIAIGGSLLVVNRSLVALDLLRAKAIAASPAVANLSRSMTGLNAALTVSPGAAAAVAVGVGVLGHAALTGSNPVESLVGAVDRLGDSIFHLRSDRLAGIDEDLRGLVEGLDLNDLDQRRIAIERFRGELEALGEANAGLVRVPGTDLRIGSTGAIGDEERRRALRENIDLLNEQALTESRSGVETGRWSQSQLNAAGAQARRTDAENINIEVLRLLREAEADANAEAQRTIDRYGEIGEALAGLGDDLDLIGERSPAVRDSLLGLSDGFDTQELADFALGLDAAGLSAEDLGAVARILGVDVADLTGLIDVATSALEGFVSSAAGTLPTVGDLFSQIQSDTAAVANEAESTASKSGDAIVDIADRLADQIERLTEQAGDRLENLREQALDAQAALEEALTPASERDLGGAELGVDRARQRQAEAEAALEEARRLQFSTEGGNTLEDRQRAIADAELDVRESVFAVADAEERLAEVRAQGSEADEDVIEARERLADINETIAETTADLAEAIAEANADAVESSAEAAEAQRGVGRAARQAADDVAVSAGQLTDALNTEARELADFRTDLQVLAAKGFGDLATLIAEQGPAVGGALADELATALTDGNRALLVGLSDANAAFNAEVTKTTDFFRDVLGPRIVLEALSVATGINETFSQNLSMDERIRFHEDPTVQAMDELGQAVAGVALSAGEEAARSYGEALDLDDRSIDAAIAAGIAIRDNAPVADFRAAAEASMQGFIDGIDASAEDVNRKLLEIILGPIFLIQELLGISSPSTFMAELGRDTIEGYVQGFNDAVASARLDTDALMAKTLALNTDGGLALGSMAGAALTAQLDDSRIVSAIERAARNQLPPIGSLNFYDSTDPGRDIDAVRLRLRRSQR